MFNQGVGAAQAGGAHDQLQPGSDGKGLIPPAAHLKRQHAAEVAHLSFGRRMTGMLRQTGIVDAFDLGLNYGASAS